MDEHRIKDKDYHAKTAHVYDHIVVEPRNFANSILFGHFDKYIGPGNLMIDLGCGTGHMLNRYRGRFSKQIGVDHSPEMLVHAKRKV